MRVIERFLSLLMALGIFVGSVVLALEVIWAVAGSAPLLIQWRSAYTSGGSHAWDTAPVRITAAVAVAVGLLLLICEIKPRRAPRLKMIGLDSGVDAAITRRSLRATLLTAAQQVDGVTGAKVKVTGRKATVKAISRLGSAEAAQGLTGQLDAALRGRLDALQLEKVPTLRAQVAPRHGARTL